MVKSARAFGSTRFALDSLGSSRALDAPRPLDHLVALAAKPPRTPPTETTSSATSTHESYNFRVPQASPLARRLSKRSVLHQ